MSTKQTSFKDDAQADDESFDAFGRDLPTYQIEIQQQSDIATARKLNPLILAPQKIKSVDYVEVDDGDSTDAAGSDAPSFGDHITSTVGAGFVLGGATMVFISLGPSARSLFRTSLPFRLRRTAFINYLTSKAKRGALSGAGSVLVMSGCLTLLRAARGREDFINEGLAMTVAGSVLGLVRGVSPWRAVGFGAGVGTMYVLSQGLMLYYETHAAPETKAKWQRLWEQATHPFGLGLRPSADERM